MKINPKYFLLLIISFIGFAQEPKEDLLVTNSTEFFYDRNQIIPNGEELKFIDKIIGSIKEIEPEYSLQLFVNTCILELEDDSFIGYKRIDFFF